MLNNTNNNKMHEKNNVMGREINLTRTDTKFKIERQGH